MLNQYVLRKLNESQQLKLALQMSQYNNMDKLLLSKNANQLRLNEASLLEIENEVADYKVMAIVLENAIKFSTN